MCDMGQADKTLRANKENVEKTWNVVREDTGEIVAQYAHQDAAMIHVLRDVMNLRLEVSA